MSMTRLRALFALVAAAALLSSCLTIEENYTFKKDGSGTMEYVIDLSAFADLMKSMEGLSDGKSSTDGMGEMDMKEESARLKAIKGISKVKVKEEKDGFVQRLSFRFADINALNEALNVLMPDSTGQQQGFFNWEGNTLVRHTNRFAEELGGDMASGEEGDSTDVSGILKTMQYKFSYTFAEDIGEVGIAEGVLREDPSARQVKLSTDWSVIMKDPQALDMRIAVKK
ncbi:MAG: hypothetical protein JNL05_06170 [Flavobacteriales bacterium]|nr:hypothetical protein [Flavobacteriales bacterium]